MSFDRLLFYIALVWLSASCVLGMWPFSKRGDLLDDLYMGRHAQQEERERIEATQYYQTGIK